MRQLLCIPFSAGKTRSLSRDLLYVSLSAWENFLCLFINACNVNVLLINHAGEFRGRGGIGRRARLRIWWSIAPWRFKSSRPHHF